jgi:erythromycin esterase
MSASTASAAAQPNPVTVSAFDLHDAATSSLLGQITSSATVVGLGEAAHFVSEFNMLRADIVERLIDGHGITHLALEVGPDEAPAIESWLHQDHDGRLPDLIGPLSHCLYGSFLTELRNRLGSHHRVGVIGVDLPNSLTIEPSLKPLAELLKTIDPESQDLVVAARRAATRITGGSAAASAVAWMSLDSGVQDELTVTLVRLSGRINALGHAHAGTDQEDGWRRAGDLIEAAITTDLMLRAMAELFSGVGRTADTTLREHFVASRILRAVEHGELDDRIAYVAHNNHIQKTPVIFDQALTAYPAGLFLAQALGERYVSIALTHLGSDVPEMAVPADNVVGFNVETVPVEPPRPNSIERAAMDARLGDLVIVQTVHDNRTTRTREHSVAKRCQRCPAARVRRHHRHARGNHGSSRHRSRWGPTQISLDLGHDGRTRQRSSNATNSTSISVAPPDPCCSRSHRPGLRRASTPSTYLRITALPLRRRARLRRRGPPPPSTTSQDANTNRSGRPTYPAIGDARTAESRAVMPQARS